MHSATSGMQYVEKESRFIRRYEQMTLRNRFNIWLTGILERRKLKRFLSRLASVGRNVYICNGYSISSPSKLSIGSNTWLGENFFAKCEGGVTIGSGVIISRGAEIWTANHNYDSEDLQSLPYDRRFVLKPVNIGDNVWIGSRVTIIPGVSIGEGAVIGAGAVVTHDIPPLAVAGGNPAKVIKYRNQEVYEKLKSEKRTYLDIEYDYDVSTLRKSEYLKKYGK